MILRNSPAPREEEKLPGCIIQKANTERRGREGKSIQLQLILQINEREDPWQQLGGSSATPGWARVEMEHLGALWSGAGREGSPGSSSNQGGGKLRAEQERPSAGSVRGQ